MVQRDEPDEIVIRISGDRAIVIGPKTRRSRWGRRIADLAPGEWSSLLRALEPATRAFVESQRWAGGLVELDAISQVMWSTARKVTEEGGWVQAVFREEGGKFAHLMRVRPGSGIATMAGGVAALSAIAAQAQAAQMARDIRAVRQRVADIYQRMQSDQIGAVENTVERVEDLVTRLRDHGTDGIEASEIPIARNGLGDAQHKCMRHLKDALARLEETGPRTPHQARKILSDDAVETVVLYLDLLGKIHLAAVQLELAQIAVCFHDGKLGLAKTLTVRITRSAARFCAEIDAICGGLAQLDADIHKLFRPAWQHLIRPGRVLGAAAGTSVGYIGARKLVPEKSLQVPGLPIPIPLPVAVAGVGVMSTLGKGAVDVVRQPRAEKELDDRLRRLAESRSRSVQILDQVTPSLAMLQTLTGGLSFLAGEDPPS